MHRHALREDQWNKIKEFLPCREGHAGGTAANNRLFVDAVTFRYRSGVSCAICRSASALALPYIGAIAGV